MKHFYFLFLAFIALACHTTRQSFSEQANRSRFNNISESIYVSIVDKDTLRFTEIHFENKYASFKTAEAMYINRGIWDEVIRTSKKELPMLVWKDVKLFSTDSIPYNIITYGDKSKRMFKASMMVLNTKGQDLLTKKNQKFKDRIINWMGEKINSIEEGDFYWKYMETVDPDYKPIKFQVIEN
ncbi:hypothetical protein [Psychroflexus tropicus]|uniref:hypothetical protein n=1 Tax=Psychroflexus tropicus TaxID=197345 RepID=UPI00038099FF|nr:hypothetical protein [Psychroflexus tropicus]